MQLLKGKRAIVTGATTGIGKEIAKVFIEQGAEVIVIGTNTDRGARVEAELGAKFYQLDVSDHSAVKEVFGSILEKWGGVDILVNCAGITRDKLLMKMSEEDWDRVLDVNLKSCYNCCSALVRSMVKARSGRIINISSVIGLTGNAGQVNYSASKFGMNGFTKSLAIEVAARGITVNSIAPGFIETDMTDKLSEKQREEIIKKIPMSRLGSPRDIANTTLFLGSDLSGYLSGQVITVDGGMLA